MRTLFVCNTYYQLLVAVQLRLTLYEKDYVGVCVSEHSLKSKDVASNLGELKMFDQVHHLPRESEPPLRYEMSLKEKARLLFNLGFGNPRLRRFEDYDSLVFFNPSFTIYEIADSIQFRGGSPKLRRMEEGLVTCDARHSHNWNLGKFARALNACRKILKNRPDIPNITEEFYCFFPELCDDDFPLKPIKIPSPKENREEISSVLRETFAYEGFPYSQKYIFFASSADIDGNPTGETEVVLRLAKELGSDNLLVKMHPRDSRTIYQDAGIAVMDNSHIPWEIVQLCENLSDRIFLTCTSGAPLSMTALLDDGTRAVYIKPQNPTNKEQANLAAAMELMSSTITKLHKLNLCENICEMTVDEFCALEAQQRACQKQATS